MTSTTTTSTTPIVAVSLPNGRRVPGTEPIPLPITVVTCLEDRAQVERSGPVRLVAGVQRLRIGPVTPLAVDRSLRADVVLDDADGAAGVVDSRVVRAYTPVHPDEPGDDASELRRRVHEMEREAREAERHRLRLENRLAVIAQIKADLHRDITEGAGAGDADPERWADRLERVDAEAEARAAELRRVRQDLRDLHEELAEARQALARAEEEPEEMSAVVEVVVEAERAGPAVLRVAHLVPCALWRPGYRATLAPDGQSVRLETDAVVWQRTGENWDGVRLSLSTARPTLAANPPVLAEDVLMVRDRTAEERRTVEVELREEAISHLSGESRPADGPPQGSAERAGSAELPGVDDGGEAWVMAAPAAVSVASDGRPHRVHLSSFTAPCRAELACSPQLSPLVIPVARFDNEAGHVLLAGPVDLVRGSGFVGRGELGFVGVGEELRLPFGSEDVCRVVRHEEESRDTTGLTGINSRTVITRTVRLFVSRLDAAADGGSAAVVVRERIPVSEVSEVEVRLVKDRCQPEPDEVDTEGIVRYDLHLGPGERREIELVYDVIASAKVAGL